jgi:glycosyltransferase involved in cell wall biosynthesis
MPAYNNEGTIRLAIESLLAQTLGDFKIHISDDGSTDGTEGICRQLAKLDRRIVYFRQSKNLRYQNFGYLLREANSAFFMWAAGDDRWAPLFVQSCIGELTKHATLMLAVPKVQFEVAGQASKLSHGTYDLLGDQVSNLARYLSRPDDNSRMYGIFRTEQAKSAFPAPAFHAYDWAFSAATLRFGGHAEIQDVLMYRDETPDIKYVESIRTDSSNAWHRLAPLWPMTKWLLDVWRIPRNTAIRSALLALNVDAHVAYMSRFHPTYAKSISPLSNFWRQQIQWRLRQH